MSDGKQLPLERVEELMLKAADLVDDTVDENGNHIGEELRPLLDYWKAKYVERKNRKSALDEVRELIEGT